MGGKARTTYPPLSHPTKVKASHHDLISVSTTEFQYFIFIEFSSSITLFFAPFLSRKFHLWMTPCRQCWSHNHRAAELPLPPAAPLFAIAYTGWGRSTSNSGPLDGEEVIPTPSPPGWGRSTSFHSPPGWGRSTSNPGPLAGDEVLHPQPGGWKVIISVKSSVKNSYTRLNRNAAL